MSAFQISMYAKIAFLAHKKIMYEDIGMRGFFSAKV
jgi:hypothetical protein